MSLCRLRPLAALISAILAVVLVASPAWAAGVAFTFSGDEVTAPVGLAADPERGVYWTVNATEASTTSLIAVKPDGTVAAEFTLSVPARKPAGVSVNNGQVWIIDDGTTSSRARVSVVKPPATLSSGKISSTSFEFNYPEPNQHPLGAYLADDGAFLIFTGQGRIYSSGGAPKSGAVNGLVKAGDCPVASTSMTKFGPGWSFRTLFELITIDGEFNQTARENSPEQTEGFGIGSSLDQTQLLLTATGAGTDVLAVTPGSGTDPSANPSGGGDPSSNPSTGVVAVPAGTDRTGTFAAIGAALVLALITAMVAFGRNRRQAAPPAAAPRRGLPPGS